MSCCLESQLRSYKGTVQDLHTRSKCHTAWRLSWDHKKYSIGHSHHIPMLHCLETQLRSYTGTVQDPHTRSQRHTAWRLSWYTYQRSEPPTFRPPQTSYRPAYHSNTNSITRYKKHRPRYKPQPVYKPSKSFSRNKKWKSRRRGLGPPKKRNIFPKFLEFLRSKRK